MTITPRRLVLWFALAALAFAPTITGAMPIFHGARYLPYAVLVFSIFSFSFTQSTRLKRLALVVLSIFLAVTVCDLVARPLMPYVLELRPTERFGRAWPPQPHLLRYVANVHFEGVTFGDIAALSPRKDLREERRVRFITDNDGFRNDSSNWATDRPLDLIVLGDSFCAVGGTTQAQTMGSVLAKDHSLNVYNLSIGSHGPLQEYATLVLESGRLKEREGTTVLWVLFTGNDLDDSYFTDLETLSPPILSWRAQLAARYTSFREGSAVRQLMRRADHSDLLISRTAPDGRTVLFFKPYADRTSRTVDEVRHHPNFAHLSATFTLMRQFAQTKHLRVVVAVVPSKEEVYSWLFNREPEWTSPREPSGFSIVAHEFCDLNGFKFFDLKPTLIEASERKFKESGELLWWRDDTHWNGVGQRVAADAIYEKLLREIPPSRYSLP
jgi:SGNH hydrolase-like domain, acetyltransferase AlgX